MTRTLSVALMTTAVIALATTSGEARTRHHPHYTHTPRYTAGYGWSRWSRGEGQSSTPHDAAYALAVRQGGPCGLTVERMIFGRSDHTIGGFNPWLARDWGPHRFPQAAPASGLVAVWKDGRHVGVVGDVHSDGSFSVTGSSHISRVTLAQVWVVDPHGGTRLAETAAPSPQPQARRPRYAYRYPQRRFAYYHQRYAYRSVRYDETPGLTNMVRM